MSEIKQSSGSFDEIAIIARQAFLGNYTVMFQPEDATLFTRGNGRGLKLYDEIDNDPKVWETLQKRKLALVSREWQVEPASTSRIDKRAADLVKAQLKNVGFDQLTSDMLDATLKGVSFIEPIWARDGAEIALTDAVHVEPWYFSFDRAPKPDDLVYARHAVRLLNGTGIEGIAIPQRKMMVHRYGQKYNSPWGLGLGSRLFWPAFFKRNGIQFWLAFAERFGTPVPIGKYPNNAQPQEKATLKNALRAFQQESAIMVPQGMEISLLEAARSGIDTYEKLVCYMDEQIAGIVLGKSGGKSGSGGQLAASLNLENEVRLELVKGDADLLTDTLTGQLIKWMVEFNCPGATTPRVERVIEETKDLKELAETHKIICDMGYRPTLDQIQNIFGGEWVDTGIAKPAGTKLDVPTLNFAAPLLQNGAKDDGIKGAEAIQSFIQSLAATPDLDDQTKALMQAQIDAVMFADSWESMQAALMASVEAQNVAPLAEGIERASFAANWMGQSDAVKSDANA